MDSINHYYFKRVEDRRAVIHRILQELIRFSINNMCKVICVGIFFLNGMKYFYEGT